MRYLVSRRQPEGDRILFIESGSRSLTEQIGPHLKSWGAQYSVDLLTCYGGLPAGFGESTRVYRVTDYGTPELRQKLIGELRSGRYAYAGLICSGEPIMTKWKWLIALRVPAKVFIVNENGDYFWLNRENLKAVREFALVRAGLEGAGALRTLGRVLIFPFSVLALLLYAFAVHARRALRRGLQHHS